MTAPVNAAASSDIPSADAAFARVKAQIEAVDPAQLRAIRVEITLLVAMMRAAMPKLRSLRAELLKLYDFDPQNLDQLEDFVYALLYCHAEYVRRTKPPTDLEHVVPEATELRDMLYADAAALVKRKLLPADAIDDVKTAIGHRALFLDLQILTGLFNDHLANLAGRTAVTAEELARAGRLVVELSSAVGARDFAPSLVAEASLLRNQAYTAFMQRFDHVRAAVSYVRRSHGDADSYVPSLFASSTPRRAKDPEPASPSEPEASEAEAPVAAAQPVADVLTQLKTATFSR